MTYLTYSLSQRKEKSISRLLRIVIFLPFCLDFVNSIIKNILGADTSTSTITMGIYAILLCWAIFLIIKYKCIKLKNTACYLIILSFFFLNYMLNTKMRSEFLEQKMILIYAFFLPIACFIIPQIKDWKQFLKSYSPFACFAVMGTLILLLLNATSNLNYMEFSYSLLPSVCLLIYLFSINGSLLHFILYIIGVVSMIIFGARAPVFFAISCCIVSLIGSRFNKQKVVITLFLIFVFILISLYFDDIIARLNIISAQTDSYFLQELLRGRIFQSSPRDALTQNILYAISNMGSNIYGLFGDRQFAYPEVYAHNFVYEILLSFGWVFGIILLLSLLLFVLSSFVKANSDYKKIIITITLAYFARYIISGSFVEEYQFYYFIAIIYSARKGIKQCAK